MVVDQFSKMDIIIAYKKNIIVEAMTNLFFENVWVHFGLPQAIISDQDSKFLNTFWSNLWALFDTIITKSTAFHPQTDGQMEVVNRIALHILRMYNSKHPCMWDDNLPYVHQNYNCVIHSSTSHNLLQVSFGFQPLVPIDIALPISFALDDSSHAHMEVDKETRFI